MNPIITFLLFLLKGQILCQNKEHYINWNTTNPLFRQRENDVIISVRNYDQVNFICPLYAREHEGLIIPERFIIYKVSKEEYEQCSVNYPIRTVVKCNRPFEVTYFTLTFRPINPTPNGLEFVPNEEYHFISTSSRANLNQRRGGYCSSNNMKIIFKAVDGHSHHNHQLEEKLIIINASSRLKSSLSLLFLVIFRLRM